MKLIFVLPLIFLLSACDNSELRREFERLSDENRQELLSLRKANSIQRTDQINLNKTVIELKKEIQASEEEKEKLRNKLVSLEKENAILKETDQTYFNKAIELFRSAKSISEYKEAEEAFNSLAEKFPNSPYLANANEYKQKIQKEIKRIMQLEDFEKKYNEFIFSKNWNSALNLLENSKNLLNDLDYNQRKDYIDNEKNKPIETTINRLVSLKFSELNNKFLETKNRVKLIGYFETDAWVDRGNQYITITNNIGSGEQINVYYDKLSDAHKSYFIDKNFKYEIEQAWEVSVIGRVSMYSDTLKPRIIAESISVRKIIPNSAPVLELQ
ncbi:MAG: hypothetical protein IJI37_02895 [Opitutales bacterium]|nr:hypothetical protein [Opitutales bacterium]